MRSLLRRKPSRETERREAYIRDYSFPLALRDRVNEHYDPPLTGSQLSTVFEGLRDWFVLCLHAEGRALGMPSKAVDVAWHEFILITRDYHAFCEEAFGYYLHHTPEAAMEKPLPEAMQRTARLALARRSALDPVGIPVLFAVDGLLGVPDGHAWTREEVEQLGDRRDGGGDGGGGVTFGCTGGDGGGGDGGGGASCGGGGGGCGGGA